MSVRKVIGLLGAKGSGKDTAAKFLVQERNYKRIAFADKLYNEVSGAFGVTTDFLGDRTKVETPTGPVEKKEHPTEVLALQNCKDQGFVQCVLEEMADKGITPQTPLSPRVVMQLWGTEYRRKRGVDNYWLQVVEKVLNENPEQSYVITDVRFPNEVSFVSGFGGECIRIRNPKVEADEAANRAASGTASHASETAVANIPVFAVVLNEMGQLDALRERILAAEEDVGAIAVS